MKTKTPKGPQTHSGSLAFSLIELLVVIAIIGILAALILPTLSGVKKKTTATVCLNNLKQLGLAMNMYVHDNNDKLPYAGVKLMETTATKAREMTWDSLLNRYIGGNQTEEQLWNFIGSLKDTAALSLLKCPCDMSPRPALVPPPLPVHRRSYAMPRYMDFYGKLPEGGPVPWPPSSASQTGLGLNFSPLSPFWNKADSNADGTPTASPPSHQAAVTESMIKEPAGTIALTERIHVENVMGFAVRHDIRTTEDHVGLGEAPNAYSPPYFYPPVASIHDGRFNYLMADGHVQLLRPSQTTTNLGLTRGMWSIKAGD